MILKLILLVLAIFVVWKGFGIYKKMEAARRELPKRQAAERNTPIAADAVECSLCGTYFATKPVACGRADCPYKA
ncbi:MAG: hypothetical protein NTY59_14305 [Alphaproteobacteria bacterium]|nr:hypothetical protein [Alphaproteobacteria bacterium]